MTTGSGFFSSKGPLKAHLVNGPGGQAAEINKLRTDIMAESGQMSVMVVMEGTNVPAAAVNSIKLAVASSASAVVYQSTALDGAIGQGILDPARPLSITTAGATPADAPATALVHGFDAQGKGVTETITVPQVAATQDGAVCFRQVTRIDLPAGQGVAATMAFGIASTLGVPRKVKSRTGLQEIQRELMDGALIDPPTGALTTAVTNPPYGGYIPVAPPNGAHDYAIYYEGDYLP
jgi:hypothetical protein